MNYQYCRRCGFDHYRNRGAFCIACGKSEWWHSHKVDWDCCSEESDGGHGTGTLLVPIVYENPPNCDTADFTEGNAPYVFDVPGEILHANPNLSHFNATTGSKIDVNLLTQDQRGTHTGYIFHH